MVGAVGRGAGASCLAVWPLRACPPLGCPWLLSAGPRPPSLSSWRCMVISATTTSDPGRRTLPPENVAPTRGRRSGNWRPRGCGSGRSVSPGGACALGSVQQPSCAHPSPRPRPLWLVARLPLPVRSPRPLPWSWTQQGTRMKGAQGPPLSCSREDLFPQHTLIASGAGA